VTAFRPRLSPREAAIAALALAVLVLLTVDVLVDGPSTHLDHQIRDALQPRTSVGSWPLDALSALGDLWIAIPGVGAGALVASQYAWRLWPAVFAVTTFATVELLVLGLKAAVGRPGPGIWTDRVGYPGYFPSGHAATSTAIVAIALYLLDALALIRMPRKAVVEACVGIGALVGAVVGVRAMLTDTHFASDVVGGVALSVTVLVSAMAVCRAVVEPSETRAQRRFRSSLGHPEKPPAHDE
jgi:undecaprenyl-diphosphatase